MRVINTRVVSRVFGALLFLEGAALLISALVSLCYYIPNPAENKDTFWLFLFAAILLLGGSILVLLNRNIKEHVGKREGYLIVSLGWVLFTAVGALPFYFTPNAIASYTDAFFETMSGFTTTGSSVVENLNSFPHGLLFWRCFTQWLGGIGIMVFMLALVHLIGVKGGKQLFAAEGTGISSDHLTPRIAETAKRICWIYSVLTLAETLLLRIGGMTWFDAICHSFGSLSTGGYSTNQDSIGHWTSPFIQYVIIVFMFLAGANFTLYYLALFRGQIKKLWRDTEFRNYLFIAFFSCILVGLCVYFDPHQHAKGFERCMRDGAFQVITVFSTTGYATADYMTWSPFVISVLWVLMFIGACAGSTGGGMKVVRITILVKNCLHELNRMIHPNAVIPIKYNNRSISETIVTSVLAFTMLYAATFLISVLVLTAMGVDFVSALGAIPSCMANVGPGLNLTGPAHTFYYLPDGAKWYLSFLMLLGRLEIFTLLVIFTPKFWKK